MCAADIVATVKRVHFGVSSSNTQLDNSFIVNTGIKLRTTQVLPSMLQAKQVFYLQLLYTAYSSTTLWNQACTLQANN